MACVIQVLTVVLSLGVYLAYMFALHVRSRWPAWPRRRCCGWGPSGFPAIVKPAYARNSELIDHLVLTLSENIQGVHVVKGFGREREEIEQIRRRQPGHEGPEERDLLARPACFSRRWAS